MVRRRVVRPGPDVPAWVSSFDPAGWDGDTLISRWFRWREAVRDHLTLHGLAQHDLEAWLRIMVDVYRFRPSMGLVEVPQWFADAAGDAVVGSD